MTKPSEDLKCWGCGQPARSVCTRKHYINWTEAKSNRWIEGVERGETYDGKNSGWPPRNLSAWSVDGDIL